MMAVRADIFGEVAFERGAEFRQVQVPDETQPRQGSLDFWKKTGA